MPDRKNFFVRSGTFCGIRTSKYATNTGGMEPGGTTFDDGDRMTQQYQQFPHAVAPQAAPPAPKVPLPQNNVGWAVAALIFFWPLAFSAFKHSSNVVPLWLTGDYAGAQNAADQAKRLGKIALIVWAVFLVLLVVFYIVIFAAVISAAGSMEFDTSYPSYR